LREEGGATIPEEKFCWKQEKRRKRGGAFNQLLSIMDSEDVLGGERNLDFRETCAKPFGRN